MEKPKQLLSQLEQDYCSKLLSLLGWWSVTDWLKELEKPQQLRWLLYVSTFAQKCLNLREIYVKNPERRGLHQDTSCLQSLKMKNLARCLIMVSGMKLELCPKLNQLFSRVPKVSTRLKMKLNLLLKKFDRKFMWLN